MLGRPRLVQSITAAAIVCAAAALSACAATPAAAPTPRSVSQHFLKATFVADYSFEVSGAVSLRGSVRWAQRDGTNVKVTVRVPDGPSEGVYTITRDGARSEYCASLGKASTATCKDLGTAVDALLPYGPQLLNLADASAPSGDREFIGEKGTCFENVGRQECLSSDGVPLFSNGYFADIAIGAVRSPFARSTESDNYDWGVAAQQIVVISLSRKPGPEDVS